MRKLYDVFYVCADGFWNHKILEADSESDVAEYMDKLGMSEFDISERINK